MTTLRLRRAALEHWLTEAETLLRELGRPALDSPPPGDPGRSDPRWQAPAA